MAHIIEIENVTKTYGKHRGVAGISLTVEEGDIFALTREDILTDKC